MKKLLFILLAVVIAANTMAQAPIRRVGEKFYQDEVCLTKQEYQNLLRNTNPEAFRQYDTGRKLIISGWSIFGVGAGLAAFGSGLLIGDVLDAKNRNENEPVMPMGYIFGTAFTIASTPFLAAGIPLLSVGYTKRNKSVDTYNLSINRGPAITYSLTAGQNGIGFAINF